MRETGKRESRERESSRRERREKQCFGKLYIAACCSSDDFAYFSTLRISYNNNNDSNININNMGGIRDITHRHRHGQSNTHVHGYIQTQTYRHLQLRKEQRSIGSVASRAPNIYTPNRLQDGYVEEEEEEEM
mmetsp:Transcript_7864/g.13556  ORF Transcript_7864/g.13556 Transcript_7864/m.13556 type:complete len:132 (+) Transcript_7864:711-1106(+)